MDDVYSLSDTLIQERIGNTIRSIRLKQNITQRSLAEYAELSLSTVKKIEGGNIGSFEALLRILRILGKLDVFQPLITEDQLSPSEYYELVTSAKKKIRKRAVGKINKHDNKEDSEW